MSSEHSTRFTSSEYLGFLEAKIRTAPRLGFDVADAEIHPALMPHQRAIVRWMVAGGRRACFGAFGLGKTVIQLEAVRICRERAGGKALIVIPLGVRQEFIRDAEMLGTRVRFIRSIEETTQENLDGTPPEAVIYLTNYETVRDGKLDPREFSVASLDEASILRGFGGTKTFREFMRLFAGDDHTGTRTKDVPYRFVATATPSPNEFIELLAYAAYLDVMEVSEAKTRFFKRDSTKADNLTLHKHKEREFWLWVSSWALFIQRPSDLGFDDTGYDLPELDVRWHEVPTDHTIAGAEESGQERMFRHAAIGVVEASREKRSSLAARIAKMQELLSENPAEHAILWHDLEDERRAIEQAVPTAVSVYGSQDLDERERAIIGFSDGEFQYLAAKPVIAGSGCNFQRHCHRAIFLGIGFKFNDFVQAVHRIQRFLQHYPVRIDLIYTEAEREIKAELERKWAQHNTLVAEMTGIIREHGLAHPEFSGLVRSIDVTREEVTGDGFRLVLNDTVDEASRLEENSVDLIVTSIPFSTQYEYTPSYRDLGHTDDDEHFFDHLGFLTPNLLRALRPGRICAVHVKDRIVPGGINGLGFQTVSPFSDLTVAHFRRHGFAFMARKTVVTDVVRENNQTYRLGWTEQCKDGTKMGCGLPEYVLIFRKAPTDRSNSYADSPVVKQKSAYTRARWQVDAHGFMRSSGDRLMGSDELANLPHDQIFRLFRDFNLHNVYDFERHVAIGEQLEAKRILPVTFMLLQPPSWHPDVWSDVARMRGMNTLQAAQNKQAHLCPLPFDIVNRLIVQYSQPGELVMDPFSGLGTVPYCALKLGRRGFGVELNPGYFADSVAYCEAAARDRAMPGLFDVIATEERTEEAEATA